MNSSSMIYPSFRDFAPYPMQVRTPFGRQMMVMATEFRNAMSRLGAAVNVITTDGPAGLGGFTASAVCSVTDSPPTLLVCINQSSFQYARFEQNGVLCVNVLGADQEDVSRLFSGQIKASIEERFAQTEHERL